MSGAGVNAPLQRDNVADAAEAEIKRPSPEPELVDCKVGSVFVVDDSCRDLLFFVLDLCV